MSKTTDVNSCKGVSCSKLLIRHNFSTELLLEEEIEHESLISSHASSNQLRKQREKSNIWRESDIKEPPSLSPYAGVTSLSITLTEENTEVEEVRTLFTNSWILICRVLEQPRASATSRETPEHWRHLTSHLTSYMSRYIKIRCAIHQWIKSEKLVT